MENKKIASIAKDTDGNEVIKIVFPYDLALLQQVRGILGRMYHKKYDCWSIPLFTNNIETLISWEFTIDEKLESFLQKSKVRMYETSKIDIPGLKGTLRPFQNWGVSFIQSKKGNALIADEMGLGKTVQSLGYLQLHKNDVPVIIVCPSIAKLMWERAAHVWLTNPDTEVLYGESPWRTKGNILIINYDVLPKWLNNLRKLKAKIIIMDEGHYFKNDKAKRTKAVKKLCKHIPQRIILTGTPIENKPRDIYNAWKILDPAHCPRYPEFAFRYCNRKNNGFGYDDSGHSNEKELHRILTGSIMLRRKKVDVLTDLPAKVGSFVPMYIHNKKDYKAAEADFIRYILETEGAIKANKAKKAEALVKIGGLKKLAAQGKLPEVIEWIRDFLEVEDKLVIFCLSTFMIDAIMEAFPKIAVKLDGRDNEKAKQKSVDEFQNNPKINLFVGQMMAAGVVITLTAASNVAIAEYPWNPSTMDQAICRVDRIGQKNSVTYYLLMAENTIEEKIAKILDAKRKVANAIIDGEDAVISTLFEELMKEYGATRMIRTK